MFRWFLAAALAALPVTATAQSIEARLARVEGILAIERILVDYAAFLDGRDYDRYADLFTPDGEWTNSGGARKGRAAIRAMLETMMGPAGTPGAASYHIVTNPRVDVDGDRATAVSRYLFVMRGPDGSPLPSLAGIYRDDLVRHDGKWRISRRVAENVMPTPDEWRKILDTRRAKP